MVNRTMNASSRTANGYRLFAFEGIEQNMTSRQKILEEDLEFNSQYLLKNKNKTPA